MDELSELRAEVSRLRAEHTMLRDQVVVFSARASAMGTVLTHVLALFQGNRDFVANLQAALEVDGERAKAHGAATAPKFAEAFEEAVTGLTQALSRN